MELTEIGSRIRSERRKKGLTQARLAEKAGLSRATLNGLEMGTVRELGFHKLEAILGILGLELAPTRARKGTGLPPS
ncbi:MAG: helix-turn-helix domain-containing protein [Candidatus Deferrimicrobiaceae bacterium]